MKKPIDWAAVGRARRRLVEIKRKHPEVAGDPNKHDWIEILDKDTTMAETQQTAFRLPVELLSRLDKHVKRLQEDSPGMNITRADAVRMLLMLGLDEAEKKPKRPAKK